MVYDKERMKVEYLKEKLKALRIQAPAEPGDLEVSHGICWEFAGNIAQEIDGRYIRTRM